jgi:plastocyanin
VRKITCIVGLAIALVAPAAAGAKVKVKLKDDRFAPTSVTVAKGTTVKWVWRGKHKHDVAVASGPSFFRSERKRSGSFKKRMKARGTYQLVCTVHSPDMAMTLVVR